MNQSFPHFAEALPEDQPALLAAQLRTFISETTARHEPQSS